MIEPHRLMWHRAIWSGAVHPAQEDSRYMGQANSLAGHNDQCGRKRSARPL